MSNKVEFLKPVEANRVIESARYSICIQHDDGALSPVWSGGTTIAEAMREAKFAADTLKRKVFIQKIEKVTLEQLTIIDAYGN